MSPLGQNGELSEQEYRELQEQMDREREERQTASQMASSAAMDPAANRGNEPGYWDTLGSPDIGRTEDPDGDHIEDFLATEFSNKFAIGNIRYSDWESMQWAIENEFWAIKNEFMSSDSGLSDDDMRMMYGETRPEMTDEMQRRLRSASSVKKLMASLAIEGEGLRRGTEIHAVAKTESTRDDDDDGGTMSGIKGWLSG